MSKPYSCDRSCDRCDARVGKPGRRRCAECIRVCRACDANLVDGGNSRTCDECRTKCSRCGKPGMSSRTLCSACHISYARNLEQDAIAALPAGCARCGILSPTQWDHVKDNGREYYNPRTGKYRNVRTTMKDELRKIIDTGTSGLLQRLCPNCNWLKAYDRPTYDLPPVYGPR